MVMWGITYMIPPASEQAAYMGTATNVSTLSPCEKQMLSAEFKDDKGPWIQTFFYAHLR